VPAANTGALSAPGSHPEPHGSDGPLRRHPGPDPGVVDARDPACAGPPADAIDVQFRAPPTVSLLLDRYLDGTDTEQVVRFLDAGYREVVAATVNKLQFVAGYVADESLSWPARLEVATVAHLYNDNDGTDIRLHHHLWVARTDVAPARRGASPGRPRRHEPLAGQRGVVERPEYAGAGHVARSRVELALPVARCWCGDHRPACAYIHARTERQRIVASVVREVIRRWRR